jgi:glycosyltransferase involved in cell wall biosynthesis
MPNIKLLGDRHYSQLPAYLQHFDVAWIPHRVGEGETGGDPIKLYEYWAAGLPVVTTPIDGMERWAKDVAIATTGEEQERAIAHTLSSPWKTPIPPERTWASITQRLLNRLTA